jgi:hypothetical protein
MKRSIIFIIYFIFFICFSFSQDFKEYEYTLVKKISLGNEIGEFGVQEGTLYGVTPRTFRGPSAFCFDEAMNIYIVDDFDERLVELDTSLNFVRQIKPFTITDLSSIEIDSEGNFLCNYGDTALIKLNNNGETLFFIDLLTSKYKNEIRRDKFIILDNLVIVYLRDGKVISIKNPGPDSKENNNKILDNLATSKEIENISNTRAVQSEKLKMTKYTPSEMVLNARPGKKIDASKSYMLFKGNKLLTKNFETFYYNALDTALAKSMQITQSQNIKNEIEKNMMFARYIGKDIDGNVYWYMAAKILVFSSNNVLIDAFTMKGETENGFGGGIPVIAPSGDVYTLFYNDTGVYLYKIKRVW